MAAYHVEVGVPDGDDGVEMKLLTVSADSMDYDETGILEFSEGPSGSARLVAVFSPSVWISAQLKGRVIEREQVDE